MLSQLQAKNNEEVTLAYFFCEGDIEAKRDPRNILGNLLRQIYISSNKEAVSARIKAVYDAHERDNDRNTNSERAMSTISAEFQLALLDISKKMPSLYIMIDGVEECNEDARTVLSRMFTAFEQAGSAHVLVSNRSESQISPAFPTQKTIDLDHADSRPHRRDIWNHIDLVFESYEELKDLTTQEKTVIKDALKHKSDGMYVTLATDF